MSPNSPLAIGTRTVLAMTCRVCGKLKQGHEFERYPRNRRDKHWYLTRRCRPCRWRDLESHR